MWPKEDCVKCVCLEGLLREYNCPGDDAMQRKLVGDLNMSVCLSPAYVPLGYHPRL